MDPSEAVDDYFCRICDLPEAELDSDSLRLVQIWHSFGLILNGGLHSYLCSVGDEARNIAKQYLNAGLPVCSDALFAAHDLWRDYWPVGSPDESDPDEFRERFDPQLEGLEAAFYDHESAISERLLPIANNKHKIG